MDSTIFQLRRNVWRVERAARAAVLIDGAEFFGALRRSFLKAERSIFIVGWDIDSRTRLVGETEPDDGYSPVLVEFLSELVQSRPGLEVYILLWDYSMVYAAEREIFPRLPLQWQTPPRVTLCLDNAIPFGSSQHQKLVVVDNALAFSGGLDLTQRRWDTSDHRPHDPKRVDTANREYAPFHDVQMMVDGEAAAALALLARRRWCNAHGTEPPVEPFGDPWPDRVAPHFTDVEIGIARTQPAFGDQEEAREVEALFLDCIDRAERSIYIENQFLTSQPIARRIARRLGERPALEVVVVAPRSYKLWAVTQTLGDERIRFVRTLKQAGGDRVRVVYPRVSDGRQAVDTMVHSKVMIVDDSLVRVGSANLNNRSMGADTECDLAVEARNDRDRAAISGIRNKLIGDHCGVDADRVAAEFARLGSLVAVADSLSGNGHSMAPIDEGEPNKSRLATLAKWLLDPARPLRLAGFFKRVAALLPGRGRASLILIAALAIIGLTLAWSFTPISEFVSRERAQHLLSSAAGSFWAPLWVVLTYVLAGAVAFPVTVLIVATAATFGPWFGFLYAVLGVTASALAMYFAGALLGRDLIRSMMGSRWGKVRREIDQRGILGVAAIRMVPVAPFTLVNMIAGACSIALVDYIAGTLIGMLPGLIAVSALGHQITYLFTHLTAANLALLLLFLAAWITIAWSAQSLAGRLRRRAT